MPQTPTFGFDFESPDDQPGETLTSGESGTHPILAEQVEQVLQTQIAALQTQIDELENRISWEDVVSGQEITGTTNFPVTSGRYDMVRVTLRGELTSAPGFIHIRINGDTTPNLHRRGRGTWDYATDTSQSQASTEGTAWPIARWGANPSCVAHSLILNTDVSSSLSHQSVGYRAASGAALREHSISSGDLAANRLLTSIEILSTEFPIDTVRVWIEGHLAAS